MFSKSRLITIGLGIVATVFVIQKANEAKKKDANSLLAKLAIS